MTKHSLQKPQGGFNLVEAAIVLGVIGLVVGGIWAATSATRNNSNVTRIYGDLAFIQSRMAAIYPLSDYPTTGFTNVTASAFNFGVFPEGYTLVSGGGAAVSPSGARIVTQLSCNAGVCPSINVLIQMDTYCGASGVCPAVKSTFTAADCTNLLARFGDGAGSLMMRAHVLKNGGINSITLTPPYTLANVACTKADGYMDLRLRHN